MRPGSSVRGPSLATLLVAGLDRIFQWAPPGFVVAVPVDGGTQAVLEVGVFRAPAELVVQRRGIDRIPQVVAGAVGDMIEVIRIATHQPQNAAHHRQIVSFALCANEIRAADLTVGQYSPYRAVVVVDVDPVANIGAVAVELDRKSVV